MVREIQRKRKTFWLYGVVEPRTGHSFFWEFSHLDSLCFATFLELFSERHPHQIHLIQVDNASAHIAHSLSIPDNIRLIFQPAHAPELNPIEQFWQFLKQSLAWQLWGSLAELREAVEYRLQRLNRTLVASLTRWDYILDALSVAGI